MSLDPGPLFLSIVCGLVGSALLIYGKKQQRVPQIIAGALLIIYPYFAETMTSMSIGALVIGGGLWMALNAGW